MCGNNCKIDIASNSAFLRVLQDKLRIPVGLTELHFTGGIVEIATNNAIEVVDANTVVNLFFINFISSSYSYNSHKGLQLRGNPGMIHGCYFNFGYYGIVNAGGQLKVWNSSFGGCSYGIHAVGGCFYLSGNSFSGNRAYGIWASGMTQPCNMTGSTVQNTLTTNGVGVYYDGSLSSPLYFAGNYVFNNKIGLQVKNATVSGDCNYINNNTTYGMLITNGASVDFSGSPSSGYPQNDISDNPISLYALGMKNLFIDNGYNDLTPNVSGIQNAIKGTIIRSCNPAPAIISTQFNSWNSNGTFSSSDYSLTTAIGSKGCTVALPVTLNDASPIPYGGCGVQPSIMMMAFSPMYNCNTCDYIVTPNFYWEKLNSAGLDAMEKATPAGGNDYKESVRLFNEMLMYNINAPDAKEKYVLNYSYDKMGSAIGNAFLSEQITETENTLVLAIEVQKSVDVQNKQIAEALNTGSYLDRYYASLDKVNTYRLAGRRDLAFVVIDDMFNWTPPDEMEYLNYKSCMTHLEQDFIDELISYDEYIDAVMSCEQATNSLRVANSASATQTDNKKNEEKRSNELSQDNSITVSPNPATNVLSVYSSADKNLVVTLKDYLGRELFNGNMQNIIRIDCSKFSRGICNLQVIDKVGNRLANRKVILQ